MTKMLRKIDFRRLALWGGILGLGFVVFGLSTFFFVSSNLPSVSEISNRAVVESTKIYDRTGEILLYEVHGQEKRTTVPEDQISQFVKDATVSVEDSSFYNEPAFDWKGILRAIYVNIASRGQVIQGGSTITQQLAKKAFLSDERNIIRKLKELLLAFRIEKVYTKNEILTLYLNQIPYGANVYGIESAAQTFFKKPARDLTLAESALLAALPKAPSYYSPYGYHVDELMKRKDFILKKMESLGYISSAQLKSALSQKLEFAPRSIGGIKAPHFVAFVQDYLNKKYGEDFVRTAGLKVITTLDWELEEIAEKSIKDGVARNKNLYGGTNGALVALDPKTGQILAMVGSADYFDKENEGNFNVAAQGLRQPGSTFKPFAYLTAFEKGFTPDTIVWDAPTEFDTTKDDEESYAPNNNDLIFRGPVKLKEALANSLNIPSIKTLYLAGINSTINNAERFGITTLDDRDRYGLSLVLGGGEVTLLELVSAYGVFAREGIRNPHTAVLRVEDKEGNILEEYTDQSEKVIDPQYPRLVNDILADVKLRSSLFRNSLYLTQVPGYQIALKTGTTNDYVDAWTVGFTPNLVVGVWAGNNHREPLQAKAGSVLAAIPIWHSFTSKALSSGKFERETFTPPKPIETDNPILRGEIPPGEYHDLLYYLGRTKDSQYENWEEGVKTWLATNWLDPSRFALAGASPNPTPAISPISAPGEIRIEVLSPANGERIMGSVSFQANLISSSPIIRTELYFNNALVEARDNLGTSYSYATSFSPSQINQQNLLTFRAANSYGQVSERNVILFQ